MQCSKCGGQMSQKRCTHTLGILEVIVVFWKYCISWTAVYIPDHRPHRMKFPFELAINLPEISLDEKRNKK
jgi:hypothetical protein